MPNSPCLIAAIIHIVIASGVYARLLGDTCATEGTDRETSCSHSGSSRALLQVHSKAISPANIVSEHQISTAAIGQTAPLDEKGYAAVQAACCFDEMFVFIKRLVQTLGFEVCEEGWLSGVTIFFDCPDDGNSYVGLVETLRDGTKGPCAGLAEPGRCKPYSPHCPDFPNAKPPPCKSDQATDAPPVKTTPAPEATQAPTDPTTAPPTDPVSPAPPVTSGAPAFVSSAIGCFHYSYFAMKCKSSCPDGNDYVDASWPDCTLNEATECPGLFVDGAQMNFIAPNHCQAQCQGYNFLTDTGQSEVQPEGALLTPSDVKMILLPLGNHKKKRCNGDPWTWNEKTWGNLGDFTTSEECSNACQSEWACILALYRVDNGQCSMMKGGVCHIRDTSRDFGGEDEEYDVWEKVCA